MGGMKFAMGAGTLSALTKKTSTSTEDLGALVRELAEAGAPLEGKFNGAARAAFDQFKGRTDVIAVEITSALAGVLSGIAGMDKAFAEGDVEGSDEIRATQAGVSFESARFGAGR